MSDLSLSLDQEPTANPNDTYVTENMIYAGNAMTDALYDSCLLGLVMLDEERQMLHKKIKGAGNDDLIKRYNAGCIDSATAIYLAMERARKSL